MGVNVHNDRCLNGAAPPIDCPLREDHEAMKGLALDVRGLKETSATLVLAVQHLSDGLEKWLDLDKALLKIARLIVIAFICAIVALVGRTLDLEMGPGGVKIHHSGTNEKSTNATTTEGVGSTSEG